MTDEKRTALLGHIHVLTVAGACLPNDHAFADGWPTELGSVYHLFHKNDLVAQLFGEGNADNDSKDEVHDYSGVYLSRITQELLVRSGKTEIADR